MYIRCSQKQNCLPHVDYGSRDCLVTQVDWPNRLPMPKINSLVKDTRCIVLYEINYVAKVSRLPQIK